MESNDIANKSKPSSAVEQTSNEDLVNKLIKESLTCGSKPKIQLLELSENIQAATTNYDSIKNQWDKMKALHLDDLYNRSESVLSQKSASSLSSLKITLSEHSIGREDPDNNDEYGKDVDDNAEQCDNQVQVVLTPRSPRKELESPEKPAVPAIEVHGEESLESVKTNKRARKAKAKRKKVHGRLRNSNSKSTVATRETTFSDKKAERRKFKRQKSLDTISVLKAPQSRKRGPLLKARESKALNSKEFVEIYHNAAVKSGSLSVVSSRHSKIGPMHVPHLQVETQAVGDNKNKKDMPIVQPIIEDVSNVEIDHAKAENYDNVHYHYHAEQINAQSPDYYDAFYQRNYEMPTMASKMKRVNRPYYHRFNIRNIPFVNGTSLSPSHNLGLNIQQVLSIIKIRQPTVPGISPLLIRKVSRGVQPVSSLFEHITNQYAKSCRNFNEANRGHKSNLGFTQEINSYSCDQLRTNNMSSTNANQTQYKQSITCEPLYEEDEESHSSVSNPRSQILQGKPTGYDARPDDVTGKMLGSRQQTPSYQKQSKKYGQGVTEVGITDLLTGTSNFNYSNNKKEMTEVFTRLYDQFEKMISQHEKLKEQLEKRKDKLLVKEVAEMEEAISAKEQEIVALVNLYNEVMSLKQQMKLLHERNSFVCIATEDPAFQHASRATKSQARAHTVGSFDYDSRNKQQYPYCDRRTNVLQHHTPNALRLAGLLKQIQAFQRQLVLA